MIKGATVKSFSHSYLGLNTNTLTIIEPSLIAKQRGIKEYSNDNLEYQKNYQKLMEHYDVIALAFESSNDLTLRKGFINIDEPKSAIKLTTRNAEEEHTNGARGWTRSGACNTAYQRTAVDCINQYCIGCGSYQSGGGGQNCDCYCAIGDYLCFCSSTGTECVN